MKAELSATGVANAPRFRGERGFFEIWFFVVFDVDRGQAYWFRYTTFSPQPHVQEPARAIVWSAAFDAHGGRSVSAKAIHPIEAYSVSAGSNQVRIGDSAFDERSCCGRVSEPGRSLSWDLTFTPAHKPAHRAPWFMDHRLPLPTKVVHTNSEIEFSGSVVIDGQVRTFQRAPGLQKHIWGTRRVDELFWLYCPRFEQDPAARIEATAVRPHMQLLDRFDAPRLIPMWIQTARGSHNLFGATHLLTNNVTRADDLSLRFSSRSLTRQVEVLASCARESLVGYVYRDPAGHDLYVAQSDIASCTLELRERSHPLTHYGPARLLTGERCAALEFHSRTPIAGVSYLGWDEGARPRSAPEHPGQLSV